VKKIGYIQNEFKFALDIFNNFPPGRIFAIPVRLDNCEIPPEELEDIEYIGLFDNSWNEGLERILQAMRVNLPLNSD